MSTSLRSDSSTLSVDQLLDFNGADTFSESAERIVHYLNAFTPLTDWSVSRVTNGEQIHVHVHHEELLKPGDRVPWDSSYCSRMSAGADHVVRDARLDPNYADLEASTGVRAYAGYQIRDDRGEMFGVLCGVRLTPLDELEKVDDGLVKLLSDLLSSQLQVARALDRERRKAAISAAMAQTDALTGILNRRGWDTIVADAQERVDSFGDPVAVAVIDLDGLKRVNDSLGHSAGDELICRAAGALTKVTTPEFRVARYGGDEFMVLANGLVPADAAGGFAKFAEALDRVGVQASMGVAAAEPGLKTVAEAIEEADATMYDVKQAKKHG